MIKVIIVVVILALVLVIGLCIALIVKPSLFFKHNVEVDGQETGNELADGSMALDVKEFDLCNDFYDYAFSLAGHNYRAIIECSSVNYDLLSPIEQDMVDLSFRRCIDSLSFPITIYLQTREYDTDTMLKNLSKNIEDSVRRYPSIETYANEYYQNMSQLTQFIGNAKQKHKYVIIPFNESDLGKMSALSQEEIKEFALDELMTRVSVCVSGLAGCGISCKLLDKAEIAECMYSYFHRDYYKIASEIVFGQMNSLVVTSKKTTPTESMDSIITEMQNRLYVASEQLSSEEQKYYRSMIESVGILKAASGEKSMDEMLDIARVLSQSSVDEDYQALLQAQGISLYDDTAMQQELTDESVIINEQEISAWTSTLSASADTEVL